MRLYSANDLVHQSLNLTDLLKLQEAQTTPAGETTQKPSLLAQIKSHQAEFDQLIMYGNVTSDTTRAKLDTTQPTDRHPRSRKILRQVLPGPYYPKFLRKIDQNSFDVYLDSIQPFKDDTPRATTDGAEDVQNKSHDKNDTSSSPTVLSISQKIYDAEATRRESINTRCTTVLNTAGVLSALFVAAGQLGLNLRSGPVNNFTWAILVFFLISLAYLGYSITVALHVHGDIQGDLIGPDDIVASDPTRPLNEYNFNIATFLLVYANLNRYLNTNFKYRLQSAGRALRNGVIAIIIAGALSPWAVTTSTSTTGMLLPATHLVGNHAVASIRPVHHNLVAND